MFSVVALVIGSLAVTALTWFVTEQRWSKKERMWRKVLLAAAQQVEAGRRKIYLSEAIFDQHHFAYNVRVGADQNGRTVRQLASSLEQFVAR